MCPTSSDAMIKQTQTKKIPLSLMFFYYLCEEVVYSDSP